MDKNNLTEYQMVVEKGKLFVYSGQAAKACGYSVAEVMDGSVNKTIYYTAIYNSEEEMNKGYNWDDKKVVDVSNGELYKVRNFDRKGLVKSRELLFDFGSRKKIEPEISELIKNVFKK